VFRRDPKRRNPGFQSGRPGRSGKKASGADVRASSDGRSSHDGPGGSREDRFILYVEGPRDREILAGWARHVAPVFGKTLERSTVILGGRQPARAVDDFRRRGGVAVGLSGLVVLDRDDHHDRHPDDRLLEPGLELFVWSLRHIESYLLVPAAIRRVAPHAPDDRTLSALIGEIEQIEDRAPEAARSSAPVRRRVGPHAKRMLGAGGALGESLGVELRSGEIARAMRRDELHVDVHDLFARIAALRGVAAQPVPESVIRSLASDSQLD
jgi:hypothetical protein